MEIEAEMQWMCDSHRDELPPNPDRKCRTIFSILQEWPRCFVQASATCSTALRHQERQTSPDRENLYKNGYFIDSITEKTLTNWILQNEIYMFHSRGRYRLHRTTSCIDRMGVKIIGARQFGQLRPIYPHWAIHPAQKMWPQTKYSIGSRTFDEQMTHSTG